MKQQITEYIKNCEICSKWNKSNDAEEIHCYYADFPGQKVHMDYHYMPKTPNHNKYLLVFIDHLTKKCWLSAHSTKESSNVVDGLRVVAKDLHRFHDVISDNGREFDNDNVRKFIEEHGGRQVFARPYHPQTNGCCERMNCTFDVLSGINKKNN